MFVSLFASLLGLVSLFNYNATDYKDLNHLNYYQTTDLEQSGSYISSISGTGGVTSITFNNIQTYTIPNNSMGNVTYKTLRYYIPYAPNGSFIGYVEFYNDIIVATQQDNNNYWLPSVKVHISDYYNLRLGYIWHITNASFPSTDLSINGNIDLSTYDGLNYFYQKSQSSLLSSQYTLTMSLYLVLYPISQEDYNNKQIIFENGYDDGYLDGYNDGKSDGYGQGFDDALEVDTTAQTIFSGILNICFVPINFFLEIFNFEIFGINFSAMVSAILSVCLVIIVIRFVTGKKSGGE